MTEQRDDVSSRSDRSDATSDLLIFGRFSFDTTACRLSRDGEDVHLTPKSAAVLCLLLQRPGEVISKDEFLETVWEGVFVREESLTQAISTIRQALGDSAQKPRFIETVSGEGYRFVGRIGPKRSDDNRTPHGQTPVQRGFGTERESDGAPGPAQRWRWAAMIGTVVVLGAVGIWSVLDFPETDQRMPTSAPDSRTSSDRRIIPMTSSQGPEWDPALSPDGRWLAFTQPHPEGGRGLYVKMVDGGEPVPLVSGEEGSIYAPAWGSGSERIAFIRHVPGPGNVDAIGEVGVLGDNLRVLCELPRVGHESLSWSSDGRRMAFTMRDPATGPLRVFLLSLDTCSREPLTDPPYQWGGDLFPRFSPDGDSIAFVRAEGLPTLQNIFVVPVHEASEGTASQPRPLTSRVFNVQGLDWTADGRSLVFVDFTPGQSSEWGLWRISASGDHEPEPLGISDGARKPTIARSANRLAYISDRTSSDIWMIPGPTADRNEIDADRNEIEGEPVCSSTRVEYHPHYSDDGNQIAFISHASGKAEVWICNADGSGARRITFTDGLTEMPRWAPGNELLAYAEMDLDVGTYDIWVVSPSRSVPQRITEDAADERGPHWSRDGRAVYFTSDRTGRYEVWMQPFEGGNAVGDPVQITENGGWWPREGPKGEYVYYTKPDRAERRGIWRKPVDGGPEEQVPANGTGNNWEMFAGGIVYEGTRPSLELYTFAAGSIRQLGRAEGIWGNVYLGVTVSPDGRSILYTRGEGTSDIMLVEDFR